MKKILACICLFFVFVPLVSCQKQDNIQPAPAEVQSVEDYKELIQRLTLQVVYENGEEVRVYYVKDDPDEWVYHNDLVPNASEEVVQAKIDQLTINQQTFQEEVLQQVRYTFDFGGTYDILDLSITFSNGKEKHYGTNDQ